MPSLRLFGRPTFVSGDDLRWMLTTSFVFRFIQAGLAIPLIFNYIDSNAWTTWEHIRQECFDDYGIENASWFLYEGHISVLLYVCMSIFLALWGLIWARLACHYSSLGTPTYVEPRTPPLQKLCHVHLSLVQALRVGCTLWGVSALRAVRWYCECSDDAADGILYDDDVYLRTGLIPTEEGALEKENQGFTRGGGNRFGGEQRFSFVATGAVEHYCGSNNAYVVCFVGLVTTHIIDFAIAVSVLVYMWIKWMPLSHIFTHVLFLNRRGTSWSQEKWKLCCRCCFANLSCLTCCLFGGAQSTIRGDLSDFAMIMTKYFTYEEYLDVTLSDSFAALIMLRRLHLEQEIESKKALAKEAMEQHEQQLKDSQGNREDSRQKLRLELLNRMAQSMYNLPHNAISPSGGAREADKATQSWDGTTSVVYQEHEYRGHNAKEEDGASFLDARQEEEEEEDRVGEKAEVNKPPDTMMTQAFNFINGFVGFYKDKDENTSQQENKDTDKNNAGETPEQAPPQQSRRHMFAETHGAPVVSTREVRGKRMMLVPQLRQSINLEDPKELYLLAQGARFIHHAEAIYFWATYSTGKHFTHLIVEKNIHILRHIQEQAEQKFLGMARAVLTKGPVPGIHPQDVEYVQFKQSLRLTPYSVVVDHAWKSVVVSVRGTDSLDDVLTDISLKPIELTDAGQRYGFEGEGRYCHRGVLSRVEWIYNDLKKHQLLSGLLGDRLGSDMGNTKEQSNGEKPRYPHYRLLVTGHSLGAACATLLTLCLKEYYPRVRCIAYSPPGCTVCSRLAEEMEPYVTSYILDTDIVGRSSVEGFMGMRDEMLEMIARIRVHKSKVLVSGAPKDSDGRRIPMAEFNKQTLCRPSEIDTSSEYVQNLEKFYSLQTSEAEKSSGSHGVKLYPPGRIIQMFRTINLPQQHYANNSTSVTDDDENGQNRTGFLSCCKREATSEDETVRGSRNEIPYTARWARRTDFRRIILSSHFISDHETANVKGQLHLLANRAGLHEPFIALDDPPISANSNRRSMAQVRDLEKDMRALDEPVELV